MKITQTITVASALLLAAGCAHEKYSTQMDQTGSPGYGYSSARTDATGEAQTPQGSQSKSDNAIVAQVRETLSRDPEIAFVVPNLKITANNGAISLSGSVQSEEQKRQILSKVQSITGVVTVNNQLNVIGGDNSNGSQLNPTSNSGSDRLYKDAANGPDNSTNNVLNPTSNDKNGSSQLYQESGQSEGPNNMVPSNPGENAPAPEFKQ